eukprot:COSAG06_NODE_9152_length_1972_cov_59.968614_1_plen_177_part_00
MIGSSVWRPSAALALHRSPSAYTSYIYACHTPGREARAKPRLGCDLFDLLEDGLATHPLRHHTDTLLHRRPWMLRKAPAATTAHPTHHTEANTATAAAIEEGRSVIVAREVSFACELPLLVAALALLVGLGFREPPLPGLITDAAGALRATLYIQHSIQTKINSRSHSHSSTMRVS